MSLKLLKEKTNNLFFRIFFFFFQKSKNKKNFLIFLLIAVLLLVVIFLPLKNVTAVGPVTIVGTGLGIIGIITGLKFAVNIGELLLTLPYRIVLISIFLILTLLSTLSSVVIGIVAFLLSALINNQLIGLSYTDPATNPIIDIGLEVTIPLANMFIILAFVVIAIATILRVSSYKLEKMLPTLIIIALLVNFSPLLCGIVVDFSNVIINTFVRGIGGFGFSKHLLKIWTEDFIEDINNLFNVFSAEFMSVLEPSTFIGPIARYVAIIIYSLGASFVMLIYFALFTIRHVAIWLITIIAPLAMASYILPETKRLFDFWWKQLIQWSFVGVIGIFFLYLGSQASRIEIITQVQIMETSWVSEIINALMPPVFAVIILLMGFFTAISGSALFAKQVYNYTVKGIKSASGLVTAKTAAGIYRQATTKPDSWSAKALRTLDRVPFVEPGSIEQRLRRKAEMGYKISTEDFEKGLRSLKGDELVENIHYQARKRNNDRMAKGIEVLTSRSPGKLKDVIKELKKLDRTESYDETIKKALKVRPDLAHHLGRTPQDIIHGMNENEIRDINIENYTSEVMEGLLQQSGDRLQSIASAPHASAKIRKIYNYLQEIHNNEIQQANQQKRKPKTAAEIVGIPQETINFLKSDRGKRKLPDFEKFL